MASFGVNVDTTPMASKMESISQNVNLTTGAVVVMKDSLLQAELEATDLLCKNVNGGFYDLIVSQITQKSALSQSETKAFALELVQQTKELRRLQERMNKDYAMITKRNASLFNSLNKELENRIIALDKEVIDFAKKEIKKVESRVNEHVAAFPVNQSETLSVSQVIAVARIKAEADVLIESMAYHIKREKQQEASVYRISFNRRLDAKEYKYIPVLYYDTATGTNRNSYLYTPHYLSAPIEKQVYEGAKEAINDLPWKRAEQDVKENIRQALEKKMAQNNITDRIKKVMLELFEQSSWDSLNV
jgi:hypothetical protein